MVLKVYRFQERALLLTAHGVNWRQHWCNCRISKTNKMVFNSKDLVLGKFFVKKEGYDDWWIITLSPCCDGNLCFWRVTENVIKYSMIFTLNFHKFVHTMDKYVLNSVVKISVVFAQYFEYYAIILGGHFCARFIFVLCITVCCMHDCLGL